MSTTNIKKIANECKEYVNKHGMHRVNEHGVLLYLSLSGSVLHGTNHIESDYDIKGIYLPYKSNLLNTGKHKNVINFKNFTESGIDVDFEVWSLQYIKHLLTKGDSNIIDCLFSCTYQDSILYQDVLFGNLMTVKYIKENILYNKMAGIVGYCLDQAEKYNVKINTLKVLTDILDHIENYRYDEHTKLVKIFDCHLPVEPHVELMEKDGNQFYKVFGKLYQSTIKLEAFKANICSRIKSYGNRAKTAFENEGFDWKSLAHAYRAGLEYHELLTDGSITFPLKNYQELLNIKNGNANFEETKTKIGDIIDIITQIDDGTAFDKDAPDLSSIDNVIQEFYHHGKNYPTCFNENKLELI